MKLKKEEGRTEAFTQDSGPPLDCWILISILIFCPTYS